MIQTETHHRPASPAGTLPAGFDAPTTRASLMVIVEQWDELTSRQRDALLGVALPHLDSPTARDYITEAITHWGGADAIRDGSGTWRDLLGDYLTDDDRSRLEDAAELTAAEECARAAALGALDAALNADRDALARSRMEAAVEHLDALTARVPA